MLTAISAPALIESVPEAVVVVDELARIRFVNGLAEKMFGYDRSELIDRSLDWLIPAPKPANQQSAWLLDHPGELFGRRKDAREFPVEVSLSRLQPTAAALSIAVIRDRTLQVAEQAALLEAARAHAQLECATVGIMRVDERGVITHMNEAWRTFVHNNQAHEATCVGVGQNYLEACRRSGHGWAQDVLSGLRSIIDGESHFFDLSYCCHSPDQLRWFRLQARRPSESGSRAVVLTHIDITQQALVEARSSIQAYVAEAFTKRKSLVATCLDLAHIVSDGLAWDCVSVWVLDWNTWTLRCEDAWTRPGAGLEEFERAARGARLPSGVGLPGKTWSTRQGVWVTDLDVDLAAPRKPDGSGRTLMPPSAIAAGLRSGLAFAVHYDDDVLAVIELFGRIRQPADPALLHLLEVSGVQLATGELRDRAERRAEAAQAEADAAREQLEAVLGCVPALVMAIDRTGSVHFVNQTVPDTRSTPPGSANWHKYVPAVARSSFEDALRSVLNGGPAYIRDVTVHEGNGQTTWCTHYMGPIRRGSQITGALFVSQDVTEMKRAQQELFGAQRLASIGTLAAGVAHEINTPIQFVGDSVDFLREASQGLFALIESLLELRQGLRTGAAGEALEQLVSATQEAEDNADLEYLREHVPRAFDRCVDGLERVTTIVRSMKEFSHPSEKHMAPVDLNRAINATLTVARNEYKYVADLETDFADLPPVTCHVNDINQVVLNIVVNAAHAIDDVVKRTGEKGAIKVRTFSEGGRVVIAISDTGGGIPEAIGHHIFDPFFTTKEVGRGTGQGLAIAWTAVTEKHAGELTYETKVGVGTTFFIRLPMEGKPPVGEIL